MDELLRNLQIRKIKSEDASDIGSIQAAITKSPTNIDFRQIMERLKKIKLHGYSLIIWKGYINKVAYNAARNVLVKAGLLPKDRRCGTCRYLPWSKPYICLKKKEERKKSDPPCDEYCWEIEGDVINIKLCS